MKSKSLVNVCNSFHVGTSSVARIFRREVAKMTSRREGEGVQGVKPGPRRPSLISLRKEDFVFDG